MKKAFLLFIILAVSAAGCRKPLEVINHSFKLEASTEETKEYRDRKLYLKISSDLIEGPYSLKYNIDGDTGIQLKDLKGKTVKSGQEFSFESGAETLTIPALKNGKHFVTLNLSNRYHNCPDTIRFSIEDHSFKLEASTEEAKEYRNRKLYLKISSKFIEGPYSLKYNIDGDTGIQLKDLKGKTVKSGQEFSFESGAETLTIPALKNGKHFVTLNLSNRYHSCSNTVRFSIEDHSFTMRLTAPTAEVGSNGTLVVSVEARVPKDVFRIRYSIDGSSSLQLKSGGKPVGQNDILKLSAGRATLTLPMLGAGTHNVSVILSNGYAEHTEKLAFVIKPFVESISVDPQKLYFGNISVINMAVKPFVHETPIVASGYDRKIIDIIIDNNKNTLKIVPLRTGKTFVTLKADKAVERFEVLVKQKVRLQISSAYYNKTERKSIYANLEDSIFDTMTIFFRLDFKCVTMKYYGGFLKDNLERMASLSGEKRFYQDNLRKLLISRNDFLQEVENIKRSLMFESSSNLFMVDGGTLYLTTKFSDNEDCYELDIYYPQKYNADNSDYYIDPLKHVYIPYEEYIKMKL